MFEEKTPTVSPELRLADKTSILTRVLRDEPHEFAIAYRAQRNAFWSAFDTASRFEFFGSDFFADILAVASRPEAASDLAGERPAKIARVRVLCALRRLQGADMRGALALLGGAAGVPSLVTACDAAVLGASRLHELATALSAGDTRAGVRVADLVPLLQADMEPWAGTGRRLSTCPSGPEVGILFHFTSGGARAHPGYGVLSVARMRTEITDRGSLSRYALNGAVVPPGGDFEASIRRARDTAGRVSRASGGPDLRRGQVVHIDLDVLGLPEGESAGVGFALLFASEARSAWARVRLEPHPGTAATGRLDAEGFVRDVSEVSLRAKLRRAWESSVRCLVVPASQLALCQEILSELRREYGGEPPLDGSGAGAAGGAPAPPLFERWVAATGASNVEQVGQWGHFVQRPRSLGDWSRRQLRRSRVAAQAIAVALALGAAAYALAGFRHGLQSVELRDGRVHGRYRYGPPRSMPLAPERNAMVLAPGDTMATYAYFGDLDSRRGEEIVLVSVEVGATKDHQGWVRVDRLDPKLRPRWTRFVDTPLTFVGRPTYPADQLSPDVIRFQDCTGDGIGEILIACNHLFFPSVLLVLDLDGEVLLTYVNQGHIEDLCVAPDLEKLRAQDPEPSQPAGTTPEACGIVFMGYSQEDAGVLLGYLAPRSRSGAFPAEREPYRHTSLPAPHAEFVKIPPSAFARMQPERQSWPSAGLDLVAGPPFRIKVATEELQPQATLLRYFDAHLRQVSVEPTTAFMSRLRAEAARGLAPDPEALRASIETVRAWRGAGWVEERQAVWEYE